MRYSRVKGEGRRRAHFGWSVTVLWEETGFRLDSEGCGWVRNRDKGFAGIRHGVNKHRGGRSKAHAEREGTGLMGVNGLKCRLRVHEFQIDSP